MNLVQKKCASAEVVGLNILSSATVGYLAGDTIRPLFFSFYATLIAGITVGLDKYINQNIISNKSIQYALTAVEGFMFVPTAVSISEGNLNFLTYFFESIIDTRAILAWNNKLKEHACLKVCTLSIIIQALALKYIWDQDDSSNATDDITTELDLVEIEQMDDFEMVDTL